MNAQKSKPSKFVLGPAELEVLAILNRAITGDEIASYLVKNEIVTSKYSGKNVTRSLQQKGFLQSRQKEIKVTEAGKLLQNALTLTGVIKAREQTQKGEIKEKENDAGG